MRTSFRVSGNTPDELHAEARRQLDEFAGQGVGTYVLDDVFGGDDGPYASLDEPGGGRPRGKFSGHVTATVPDPDPDPS
ncbi:hypothetical protein [Pseudonocardia sp. McavD-2-B]|uniref:hypothetical protein n=1 Tax=Pseudonocardia sp. McavD-2-B TaxID=2954499 RepID=UPI0020984E19|nr:hypothetical protein [Pseudonocardia sp. McavD-2-B]MCO7195398.1 hypothetical protein [Pseudonocardia sp. McavD-2-B]